MSQLVNPVGQREERAVSIGLAITVFSFSLAVFWYHSAPSVAFHDSGEFAMAAASMGVPHPPGAPTWTLLAGLFVRAIGFADPARATNLFSALFGAITLSLTSLLTFRWLHFPSSQIRLWHRLMGATVSILVLLNSAAFIEQCLTTEQYTLMTSLFCAMLLIASHLAKKERPWHADGPSFPRRYLWELAVFGWIWGLAIGNHLSQIALAPFVIWVLWAVTHARRSLPNRGWFQVAGSTFLGLFIGLLIYLYVPIRSRAEPLLDWGNMDTFKRLMWGITRQYWQARPISDAPRGFVSDWLASYDLGGQLGLAGMILMMIGIFALVKHGKVLLGWLASSIIPYSIVLLVGHLKQRNIDPDYLHSYGVMDWHLPIFTAGAVAAGLGMGWLLSHIRWRMLALILGIGVCGGLALNARGTILHESLSGWTAPQEYAQAILAPLPHAAVILVEQDNLISTLGYHCHIVDPKPGRWLGTRPSHIAWETVGDTAAAEPSSMNPRHRLLQEMVNRPEGQIFRSSTLTKPYPSSTRIFVDFVPAFPGGAEYLLPCGYLFEVVDHPTSDQEVREAEQAWRAEYPNLLREPRGSPHRLERDAWSQLYRRRGAFFQRRGMWTYAAQAYGRSLQWIEPQGSIWFNYAYALAQEDRLQEASQAYEMAIKYAPRLPGPRINLAGLRIQQGLIDEAIMLLTEELKLYPDSELAKRNLELLLGGQMER